MATHKNPVNKHDTAGLFTVLVKRPKLLFPNECRLVSSLLWVCRRVENNIIQYQTFELHYVLRSDEHQVYVSVSKGGEFCL
jgi:hypothetical protein